MRYVGIDVGRKACLALTGNEEPDEGTLGERLLSDLIPVFKAGDPPPDALTTETILDRLSRIPEARGIDPDSFLPRPRE